MKPIRVVLTEDHALVRAGLKTLLETMQGVEVVGEASDGRAGLRPLEELRPDVALVNVSMPELNGLDTVHQAVKAGLRTRIIVRRRRAGVSLE